MRIIAMVAVLITVVVLVGCGGAGSGSNDGCVTVSPSSVSLAPGQQVTFTITGCDSLQGICSTTTWSCPGGSFRMQCGLSAEFAAGDKRGDYMVTVTDGHVTGYACVHID